MPSEIATRFMAAVETLEATGETTPLTDLFAKEARLSSLGRVENGPGSADRYWSSYRAQFADICSRYDRIVESAGDIVLVWQSEGHLSTGRPIAYGGVSLLRIADGTIAEFESYYDSAAFTVVGGRKDGS